MYIIVNDTSGILYMGIGFSELTPEEINTTKIQKPSSTVYEKSDRWPADFRLKSLMSRHLPTKTIHERPFCYESYH